MASNRTGTWLQLFHWGPILALSVIFTIAGVTLNCTFMWWPITTVGGAINALLFLTWVFLTLYNYLNAAWKGPGFVPLRWSPENKNDANFLQYCDFCEGYKAPRSHHCRKCNRCVMKMDHHCPWINTCCGHFNHCNFVWFLFFAPCGCVHAVIILIPSIYRALNYSYYYYYGNDEPLIHLSVVAFILTMFGVGLAIGVIIAVGMLFYVQMKSIWRNETGIESWIIDKAEDRERDEDEGEDFIYPYDLGVRENLRQVFTFTGKPVSDGITWDVVEGCDQYTLTVEQIKQKAQKRERTLLYVITEPYSGAMFPITKGCRVLCFVPCTDEPRISVLENDRVMVTRWKKHWLYGTKVLENGGKNKVASKRVRGWFPRRGAKELIDNNMNDKKAV
ncbi:palmitoyltransferase ZDHHC6-like [Haliotis asinina]|uniref:palmitoyltransferase ZDHHC6-like n=1 Tax=Haliotis asinina TaxID=109174 RepID=UPI0035319DA4